MRLKFTVAALLSALVAQPIFADEHKASTPAAQVSPALAPATDAAQPEAAAASKPQKNATARKPADYAPAQDLLLSAMSLIGVKYKWGGNTPESGLDCSGFVNYVFKNSLNIALPRTALGMSGIGDEVEKDDLKAGDLVFFNTMRRKFSHVGIYLGDGRFIHSPRKGRSVEIVDMNQKYWITRFNGGRRMSDLNDEGVDVNALLAGRPARVHSANTAESKSCKKVTSVRKGKKVTSTVCSTAKPNTSKASTPTKAASKATVKSKTPAKAKTPVKKPAAKPAVKKKP